MNEKMCLICPPTECNLLTISDTNPQAKAAGYLEQLDKARCEGDWAAIPELVRKVRKHAPDKACLALTAEVEAAISKATAVASAGKASTTRPATGATDTSTNNLDVSGRVPQLLEAIEKEDKYLQDRFQAQVCVGWLHWAVAEYSQALVRLPKSLDQQDTQLDPSLELSEWITVCTLRAFYLRANCLARNYNRKEALAAFMAGLPALNRVWSGRPLSKQLAYWAELFLTEFSMLASQAMNAEETSLDDPNALASFRSWAQYWDVVAKNVPGGYGFRGSVPRREVWKEYYTAISRLLQQDLPFPSGYVRNLANDVSARAKLRIELKKVESVYNALLLSETTFPRAEEERSEVERFVELVVQNWSVLCGRGWREQDLGQGGRNSLSRGVLDILYSAATKTYHSTAILRSLFLVHLSVADFDVAFKAFDSYLDIVKRNKARVDKTGHFEPSLDDDETVLKTMAQAVIALCQYGHPDVADRARQLGAELEDWLSRLPQLRSGEDESASGLDAQTSRLHPPIAPHVVALSWQAIGLSQAHWSRITHEATSRTEIQSRAIRCLKRSLAAELGRSKDVRSYYALGLLLAERRELTAAVEVIRAAIASSKGQEGSYHLLYGQYWQERSLVRMWHLLALLLSARQDYIVAARACEGALEQFKDPAILFGKESSFKSEHLNDAEEKVVATDDRKGLVDEMDDLEKEAILEVKMTQLALLELIEGPEVAVNASYELLTLFSRLFGNVASQPTTLVAPHATEPPKTSGTLRSFRGSLFGGKDRSRPPTRQASTATTSDKSTVAHRPATSKTVTSGAPTIQVTGDDKKPPVSRRSSTGHLNRKRSDSKPRNSLRKRDRSMSRNRQTSQGVPSQQSTVVDGDTFYTPAPDPDDAHKSDFFTFSSKGGQRSSIGTVSKGRVLPALSSVLSGTTNSSSEHAADTTHVSIDLLPLIQFPKEKERVQRTIILIKVWLMIAGFYRRANMLDDCTGAVTEAQKLVQGLKAESQREQVNSSSVSSVGWAETKSTDDLWGDVYSEVSRYAYISLVTFD